MNTRNQVRVIITLESLAVVLSFITYSMVFGNLAYISELHCFHKQRRDKMLASQGGCGNGMCEF